jgi:hypothetical protein
MATDTIDTKGTVPGRITAAMTIVMWFAVGAFISSTIGYYVDPHVSVDLSGQAPGLIGGTVTAVIAFIATKFV